MSAPWMPVRTRVLHAILSRLRDPDAVLAPRSLTRARGAVPLGPPVSWITGSVASGVHTSSMEIPARDGYPIPVLVHRPPSAHGASTPGRAASDHPVSSDTVRAADEREDPGGARHPRGLPLVVHFHGGGFAIGSAAAFIPFCTQLAARVGAVVASVDYRMAPEHLAPIAALDAIDAALGLRDRADELGIDADRVALVGDSAGGNLAAVVAQQSRDSGQPVAHLSVIYPAPDLGDHPEGVLADLVPGGDVDLDRDVAALAASYPVLSPALARLFRQAYLGEDNDGSDPLVSPARGVLEGMPPTLLQTAEHDPLREDGERFGAALSEAGVRVRATRYRGSPHGFINLPGLTSAGHPALQELAAEIRHHLHPESGPLEETS